MDDQDNLIKYRVLNFFYIYFPKFVENDKTKKNKFDKFESQKERLNNDNFRIIFD
jgi:hypothetical protein